MRSDGEKGRREMSNRRGRHEGTIYQRQDGRWSGALDLGWDQGRRRRKNFYGATRAEVREKLTRALGEVQRGGAVDLDERVTVGQYLDHWLGTLSVRRKTARSYQQFVALHLKPGLGRIRLTKLTPSHVRTLLAEKEQAGLSIRTVTLMRDVLRIALNQAVTDGAAARNVAALVKRPKPTRRQGPILSPDQAPVFLSRIQGTRLAPIITIGLSVGLRLGEVLGLQWSSVDLDAGVIRVERGLETIGRDRSLVALKSKESRRTIHLPDFVRAALLKHRQQQLERQLLAGGRWRAEGSSFVFTTRDGRPLDGCGVTRDLKRMLTQTWIGGRHECTHPRVINRQCADCSAEHLPPLSFHVLRHSCASILLGQGVPVRDVSEILGHSDVRLTLSTYAHVIEAGRSRAAGVMDRVLQIRA
ncbi:MAG: site-specific integrase [Acidobacteria bacterium]|nr:site-specific integrase [Acidobacteriota bacterium]